ncbi:MAG: hypothetical protein H0U27_08855 [Nitrosopumilus sp.]|nr:hypothetical protein [Nitrosopumilus sp.]
MASTVSLLENDAIKEYITDYEQKIKDIKNKSNNYLKNSKDQDFYDISSSLKSLRDNQIVLPKKIRKQKTLKEIRKISTSVSKINKKLKAYEVIDKEIVKNTTTESDQTHTRNFENYLKIKKQSLLAKSNKTILDLNSLQLTPFNFRTNNISIQNKTKKFNQKIVKLTTGIEKKVKLISSNNKNNGNNDITLKKINRLQKSIENLQIILDILSNSKEQVQDKNFNQHNKNAIAIT